MPLAEGFKEGHSALVKRLASPVTYFAQHLECPGDLALVDSEVLAPVEVAFCLRWAVKGGAGCRQPVSVPELE